MSHSAKGCIIAIDAMGGDHGPSVTVAAAKRILRRHHHVSLILVGNTRSIARHLSRYKLKDHPRLSVVHASEVVEMDESPGLALRNKKDSSMRVAINLVKEGKAHACVSAGNTGALMATSRFVLKMIPGIDRPAIVYPMPGIDPNTKKRTKVHMLDLGANVDCSAQQLFEFAIMGSVLSQYSSHKSSPRVALLNIGEEETKGLDSIKQAASMLKESDLNYIGYVEGNDIFSNKTDVIVCDGFVGNVSLKTMEGLAGFIVKQLKLSVGNNLLLKLCALCAFPILWKMKKNLDIRRYNGASLLGLRGIVIKSHGIADKKAFTSALAEAINQVEQDIPKHLSHRLERLMEQPEDGKS
jgi:glycerol-3-phosphate acyltransferase PlsX